jgi:glyoxylase-like metal-dependent hydrolase (beta-lactamase superfamily II)
VSGDGTHEALAVRYGDRVTRRSESFLNYHLYGEPDAELDVAYYFWVLRSRSQNRSQNQNHEDDVVLVDTGFAPHTARRRNRASHSTPAEALPLLGIDPARVKTVVVTHAHWDHIGNLHQFPDAEIVVAQAEYDFWTSPVAGRTQFAAHAEPDEIETLQAARKQGRIAFVSGQHTLTRGIELIEVGGHTPGELIVTVATRAGTAVLASDALHHYEEIELDRPYSVVADLPGMYRAYDLLRDLAAQPRTWLVAGHDSDVPRRFAPHPSAPAVTDVGSPVTDVGSPVTEAGGPVTEAGGPVTGEGTARG